MKSSMFSKDDLEEEFTCTICQELILSAATLECSHSFCQYCIGNWLERKKQCPVCREPIQKEPVRSRTVDNAIGKIVATLSPKEKQNWDERVQNHSKQAQEEATHLKLKELIVTAKSRGLKFLSVFDNWTPEEKKIFQDGVGKYAGKSRTLYCESTGLTEEFVRNGNILHLRQAAANIGMKGSEIYENTQELRRRLFLFIGVNSQ